MSEVKEITFERVFDAPPEEVWQAWTEPQVIKRWWGPKDVIIPECEVDLRVGGKIYLVMEAGEAMGTYQGTRWPMEGTFTEIEKNSKLSYTAKAWTQGEKETSEVEQINELTLTGKNGKTEMELKVTLKETGPDATIVEQGIRMGYNEQFDKLEELLANEV